MFLIILFRRLGLKEDKFLLAGFYGLIYSLVFFFLLSLSQYYLKRPDIAKNLIFSLMLGIAMFITYLIKYELIYKKIKA